MFNLISHQTKSYGLVVLVILGFLLSSCARKATEDQSPKSAESASSFLVPAIDFAPRQYVCYRSDTPLKIDGKLEEPIWEQAAWTEAFVDIQGPAKPAPRFLTRAKMLWDDNYFYMGAEMEEPDVWATLTNRDAIIFYDNDFEVFVDPDGDTHEYYELEVNAYSTEWDLFLVKPYRDGGPAVHSWDMQELKTGVSVDGTINRPGDTDHGWSIEIAIPWAVLKECAHKNAPPQENDQWRVNFSRVEWHTEVKDGKYNKALDTRTGAFLPEDNWVWSPQGLINMHYPEMWGLVQFTEQIAGTGNVEFTIQPEENARWALRQIYYAQRTYYMRHGTYAADLGQLGLTDLQVDGYRWPPIIETTEHFFEVRLPDMGNQHTLMISQDGHTWQDEN